MLSLVCRKIDNICHSFICMSNCQIVHRSIVLKESTDLTVCRVLLRIIQIEICVSYKFNKLPPSLVGYVWFDISKLNHYYSIPQEICTQFCCALLCCGYAIVHNEFTWSIYPYSSGLLCWHCQWSKPDGYGKISQCITTTKHSKAKNVCIFLGIYCKGLVPCHYLNQCLPGLLSTTAFGTYCGT